MFESYEVGSRCWVESETAGWVSATVEGKRELESGACELDLWVEIDAGESGERRVVKISEDPSPKVPLRNPPALEATSDLVTLSYLNEPSVLHAIRQRYAQLNIYTFSGIVLIATNPFDRVDNLYTNEVVQMYSGRQRGELEPHLFSIAEDAFRCMQRDNKNQTIVVSGESGAGKTMSAKYIMRYFATVEDPQKQRRSDSGANGNRRAAAAAAAAGAGGAGGANGEVAALDPDDSLVEEADYEGLSKTEREILATNPIMEAFGNAKTTRNDNSSRFGKYLEIRFNNWLDISGARIRTYLLERSRIVFHQQTERNYHIFYQLLRGLSAAELAKLGLDAGLAAFHYVNQGDPDIQGVDDGADFQETRRALRIVGIDADYQWRLFELLAGLLHLGNIQLKATSRSVMVNSDDPALLKCAELLGIDATQLAKWLTKKQIQMRSEAIVSDLDAKTALVVRDSIAKYLYSALFDWLVGAVNRKLYKGDGANERFIGVLDIYGFEHFQHNSFEQFCINYANEKLQQEFNQHVFKLEQQEYAAQEIDWQYIDFVDNQPCIDLIEDKMGILSLLDEESRLPAGTDDGFTQKLYGTLDGKKQNFRKPRLGQSSFIVAHYAHDVEYETDGFIEKNRDTVPDTVISVLSDTQNTFLSEVLQAQTDASAASAASSAGSAMSSSSAPAAAGGRRGIAAKRPTLGNIFKTSLIELMTTISSTNAHYIRCIKPNEEKEAWQFDGPMVLSQLRACGVLETIRISSKGFPGRWPYDEFATRYDLLLHSSERNAKNVGPRKLTLAVLEAFSDSNHEGGNGVDAAPVPPNKSSYALGRDKVFLRAGMLAKLENKRTRRLQEAAISIQKHVKMRHARSILQSRLAFIREIQTLARARLAREAARRRQAELALINVQALARRRLQRQRLLTVLHAVTGVQNAVRARQARAHLLENHRTEAATAIQTLIRARQARQKHLKQVHAMTIVQSMVRRRGARRELQRRREDQHSVKHFEENQLLMENKVVELQNALSSKREDHKHVVAQLEAAELARAAIEQELLAARTDLTSHTTTSQEKQRELLQEVDQHKSEVDDLREELATSMKQIEQLRDTLAEHEQQVQKLTFEATELRKRNEELEEQLHLSQAAQIGTGPLVSYQNRQHHAADGVNGQALGGQPQQQHYYDQLQYLEQQQLNHHQRQLNPQSTSAGSRALNADEMSEEQCRINDTIEEMLQHSNEVRDELIANLIKTVDLPTVKSTEEIPERDVLFPANITNLIVSEMWRFGQIQESESLMGAVLQAISDTVSKCSSEQLISAGPFWLSNVHELYSFMTLAESNIIHSAQLHSQMAPEELEQYATLTRIAKQDMTNLIFNIYFLYMKSLKKMLDKMIVPAVIEDQTIPGFVAENPTNRFMSSIFGSAPVIKMDNMIVLLSRILGALTAYHVEDFYIRQPLKELMGFIGAKSFNDMIMRRNFLTWRRGVQINYNITRIVEWCKSHKLDEIITPLEPITQAAKLLQLKKNWDEHTSVDFIYDICWALNPTQIQRFVSNYSTLEYEPPVSTKVHQVVTNRVKESKGADTNLLIVMRPLQDSGPFEICAPRSLEKLEPYIPQRLDVKKLRELTELTTLASRLQDAQLEQEQMEQRELERQRLEGAEAAAAEDRSPYDEAEPTTV